MAVFKLAKSLKRKQISIPVLDTVAVSDMNKAKALAEQFYKNHQNPLKNKLKIHTKPYKMRLINSFQVPHQPLLPYSHTWRLPQISSPLRMAKLQERIKSVAEY